ncbi:uncharacterized protein Z519_01408 [Cladophialophora bantiana CBS 173.52]|uniref:Heterokaryon incompatibility domain-containing protein n=1 Tax=Cladophialophora bantiana (strain ATCC 10958 / CBS 173.52 / CDC B-1940 / NIH 8579) TaxID=1442370 RepID=A0A0D2IM17_CLAB1|nr:uncharacterized protein Z519_01408 [Cladophialophora bantiana CBS 173.52]KIW97824.1 hypothetical protein Z519_01408 [Cladophialophora bantiana CBS 173.52]
MPKRKRQAADFVLGDNPSGGLARILRPRKFPRQGRHVSIDLSTYRYRPLQGPSWIRVLRVEPSPSFEEPLQVNIHHFDRDAIPYTFGPDKQSYDALSYAWGTEKPTIKVACDGNSHLDITPNVDQMLRRLRAKDKCRHFWIDAISLNQKDKAEKATQVPLMGEIYRQAAKVRVWLGGNENGGDEMAIKKIFALFRVLVVKVVNPDRDELVRLFGAKSTSWSVIDGFLRRAWFHRRWVLQEVALGRDTVVYCHTEKISWSLFARALDACRTSHYHGHLHFEPTALAALNHLSALQEKDRKILTLLWKFDHAQCTDPRDRLFALYGIASHIRFNDLPSVSDVVSQSIRCYVDYDVPTNQVYMDFAKSCIEGGHILVILVHAVSFGSLSDTDSSMPTWLPDWSRARRQTVLPRTEYGINVATINLCKAACSTLQDSKRLGASIICRVSQVVRATTLVSSEQTPTWAAIALHIMQALGGHQPESLSSDWKEQLREIILALLDRIGAAHGVKKHVISPGIRRMEIVWFLTALSEEYLLIDATKEDDRQELRGREDFTHHSTWRQWMSKDILNLLAKALERTCIFHATNPDDEDPVVGVREIRGLAPAEIRTGDCIMQASLLNGVQWSEHNGFVLRETEVRVHDEDLNKIKPVLEPFEAQNSIIVPAFGVPGMSFYPYRKNAWHLVGPCSIIIRKKKRYGKDYIFTVV